MNIVKKLLLFFLILTPLNIQADELSHGARAQRSGYIFAKQVESIVKDYGFYIVKNAEYQKKKDTFEHDKILVRRARFKTIYERDGYTDFLLIDKKLDEHIRIEVKWQHTGGSMDEKLPYIYLNAIDAVPEDHYILVIDGAGWKQGAIEWLKESARIKRYATEENKHKKFEVMNQQEFVAWMAKQWQE